MGAQPTLTITTAAALAGTTPRRIKHLIHIQSIATVEAGDAVLILQDEFTTWLAAGGMRKVSFPNRTAQRRRGAAYRTQQVARPQHAS